MENKDKEVWAYSPPELRIVQLRPEDVVSTSYGTDSNAGEWDILQ